jgi:hypothetical protein
VKTSGNRPYLHVIVPGGYKLKSLYDMGASCCCISPTLLKHISSEKEVKCKNASFNICGIVAGDPDRCLELAFVNLWFDNGLLLKEFLFWFMKVVTILFLEIMSVRDITAPCSGKMKTSSSIPEYAKMPL